MNHFLTPVTAENMTKLLSRDHLDKEAQMTTREDFDKVMQAVPNVEPTEYDKI